MIVDCRRHTPDINDKRTMMSDCDIMGTSLIYIAKRVVSRISSFVFAHSFPSSIEHFSTCTLTIACSGLLNFKMYTCDEELRTLLGPKEVRRSIKSRLFFSSYLCVLSHVVSWGWFVGWLVYGTLGY